MFNLKEINKRVASCVDCQLWWNRKFFVQSYYPDNCKAIIVSDEILQSDELCGIPIKGTVFNRLFLAASRVTDEPGKMLERCGLTVILRCPAKNYEWRSLYQKDRSLEICKKHIKQELSIVAPRIMVLLGKSVAYTLLSYNEIGKNLDLSKPLQDVINKPVTVTHGKQKITVIVTHSSRNIIYNKLTIDDLITTMQLLKTAFENLDAKK
jgi:uracil-DNA glycosylase